MKLLDKLKARLSHEESMFRAQLLREDIARLERLVDLAKSCPSRAEFERAGLYIGWTQNDMMTHQLMPSLGQLLAAVYAYVVDGPNDDREGELMSAWQDFSDTRLQKLIRCL